MGIFDRPPFSSDKKRELPAGLWEKCPGCGEMIHNLELQQNYRVCPRCDHHLTQSAHERIEMLLEAGSFTEHDAGMTAVDTLKFTGQASYADRLRTYQRKTGLKDAVITGAGRLGHHTVALGVLDFSFLGGSMGAVVGEKLTRLIEHGTAHGLPVIIISASGGARMYEGALSLMQMAKTCAALAFHAQARLPYLSVLTDPTIGGVSASFATIGDINLAEPRAVIGFAGRRVIRETTHQDLPPDFQTAEFLQAHGLIDMIVHRKKLRQTLGELPRLPGSGTVSYSEALRWLYGTQLHGIKLGLENIARLLEALGVPLTGPEAPRFLHVAGTNGKGSVCALLEAICRAAGRRTGLFTSPHLISFRERIQVDGRPIAAEAVAEELTGIRGLTETWSHSPTFFEIVTALALAHFARERVELAVIETGLGGRLDATNIVTPLISILTPIDLDHQQYLGETRAAIALEKAGIIKPGIPALSLPQAEEVETLLMHIAAERESPFQIVVSPMDHAPIGLAGSHQRWNAALAVHALDAAGLRFPDEAILRGLRQVEWPGRFQAIGDCVLDGAHNPAAALRLAQTWREVHGSARATLILGILADKDVPGICAALASLATRVLAVPVRNPRSLAPERLQAAVWESAPGTDCTVLPDVRSAIRAAAAWPERTLIAGSLFVVGEALAYLTGRTLEEESAQ